MSAPKLLDKAFELFDAANSKDPNTEEFQGKSYSKELLYAMRMTEKLTDFAPEASEVLQLTARCQHICRWEIPRNLYPMDRVGYLKWRQDLKKLLITVTLMQPHDPLQTFFAMFFEQYLSSYLLYTF